MHIPLDKNMQYFVYIQPNLPWDLGSVYGPMFEHEAKEKAASHAKNGYATYIGKLMARVSLPEPEVKVETLG